MMKLFFGLLFPIALFFGGWGFLAAEYKFFPYSLYESAQRGYHRIREMAGFDIPWYFARTDKTEKVRIYRPDAVAPGLTLDTMLGPKKHPGAMMPGITLVTALGPRKQPGAMARGLTLVTALGPKIHPEARIIDSEGRTVHIWQLDWFDYWPDATHIPKWQRPKGLPGPHIHGVILTDEGDLVFNFERGGLFRLDICGRVKWRLARMTHHSLFRDDEGNFWVPALDQSFKFDASLPGYKPHFSDFKILKVSASGKILREWRLFDILKKNNLESALYMTTRENFDVDVAGDTLHMNDVKVFPSNLKSGKFRPGDVMISIRNLNAIIVLDPNLEKIKHYFFGPFVRQHDPDFVDGNTISIFDNYTQTLHSGNPRSRILRLSVNDPKPVVEFEGSAKVPFFTNIMGKHQRLANGNMLITEATAGRAIEINKDGQIVWEYVNLISKGLTGLMDEAQRLDPKFDRSFFERKSRSCMS